MKSGLMWYDPDSRKPATVKIEEAARRYAEKFGAEPNACHVCPDQVTACERVHVIANQWIRPNYFWLGVDEDLPRLAKPTSRKARPTATVVAEGGQAAEDKLKSASHGRLPAGSRALSKTA